MNGRGCRVLHCAETIKGGIAAYLRELLPLQVKEFGAGKVAVVIPNSQISELPVPDGVKVFAFVDAGPRAIRAMRCAWMTLAVARQWAPSVIHVHSTFAGITVRPVFAALYRSARVIYCAHGWAWDRVGGTAGKKVVKLAERILAGVCDVIVCISEHDFNGARGAGISERKLVLARNGISRERPRCMPVARELWPADCRRVLFVGRIDRQKGVDILFDALRLVKARVHAVVAGASVVDNESDMRPPSNVTWVGWMSPGELETLFSEADVLVVPSRWEGFGLVAVEGMRAGLAVVAASVGGLREIVLDGVTGVSVAPESAQALADALDCLDDKRICEMGEAGRERVLELFSLERLHQELCKAYQCG